MTIVGLTGGIGSGKTTVAAFFEALDVPVYIADVEAKLLMARSKVIRRKLIALFGEEAYVDNELNRAYIASKIFNDKTYLERMNAIVHPKVASHFKRWMTKQKSEYVIKEAAIIFEQGKEEQYDFIITVTADIEERIKRVIKRDNSSRSKIMAILNNQMSDQEKIEKSHFVIVNDDLEDVKKQVQKIHQSILKKIKKRQF
ncbi:dephospho-CoA kinase [Psychroserpens luteolus]|uniref:dephospho-CoA kinase n=1 Tax=Psychroserpens luteolus TaxID=2855840 RepID=UPI001E521195|nr:dephospho-CoA kinase [Psychroserpens luteolus]MCD2259263.1 dephospho-CoA kinase [Psychroserpens luteolus]